MAGVIVPILQKRVFEHGYLGTSATQDVVIHPGLDVGSWYRVHLIVRVHQLDAQSGNYKFYLLHTCPSEEDPQEFTISTGGSEFAISGVMTTSPNIVVTSGTNPYAFLKLVLRATQVTAGNRLYGEFSAVLVLRDA